MTVTSRTIRILLTGGGSGGHIYPLFAVAQKLKTIATEEQLNLDLYYFGALDDYAKILHDIGVRIQPIATAKIRRYASLQNLLDIPNFFIAIFEVFFKMFFLMPDVVFSKGGPGALPVVFWAWFYRIPIVIHESDAQPGLTNLLSARFAKRIGVSFERATNYFAKTKTFVAGNPIREELMTLRLNPSTAKQEMGFLPNEPLVLVLGGSQGSQRINDFIVLNLESIVREVQVLHVTGRTNLLEIEKLARAALIDVPLANTANRYKAVAYLDAEMKIALAAADLVICRGGSGTLFEIASYGKPAIIIPLLEAANDHQRMNAYEFAKTGAAVVIEEPNLLVGILLNQIKTILKDGATYQKMTVASGNFAKPDAALEIAREIFKSIGATG